MGGRGPRPKGEALLMSRLVTASNALLRLARCPELGSMIRSAQERTEADHGDEYRQSWQAVYERWADADPDALVRLANVLSCLAVPDETP